ncbi:MAG: polyphosphate polymerase domain-containing protein [Desulfobulbaceae bacterium]|nr:polyphosphate polymerase domain-containing protein [Desulfobulbaceae bacterium]
MMTDAVRNEVQEAVLPFESISLLELDSHKLLDRFDTKFVLHTDDLNKLITKLQDDYSSLEIADERVFQYKTLYYDTDDNMLYNLHHNGKLNRSKVRVREYSSTSIKYFEVKFKSNKHKVYKTRLAGSQIDSELNNDTINQILKKYNLHDKDLKSKLTVTYNRMTFLHKVLPVKITVDWDLYFKNCINERELSELVIVEFKTARPSDATEFTLLMKELQIQELRVSKYCLGVMLLDSQIKRNRFKQKLMFINKMLGERNGSAEYFRV